MLIGVISDTHGLLRPGAIDAFKEAELIIHAGDIGKPAVLDALKAIAPVVAVRGNVDRGEWAEELPEARVVEANSVRIHVIHILNEPKVNQVAGAFRLVIFGHSHIPSFREERGIYYLNPGSAGPRRFHLPTTVARLEIIGDRIDAQIVTLTV